MKEADQIPEGKAGLPQDTPTRFSWLRTRMSTDRTLEAWVRTAVSLIGFGFTIVQFFDRLKEMSHAAPAKDPSLAKYVGLTLIALGTVALAIAMWQHQRVV